MRRLLSALYGPGQKRTVIQRLCEMHELFGYLYTWTYRSSHQRAEQKPIESLLESCVSFHEG